MILHRTGLLLCPTRLLLLALAVLAGCNPPDPKRVVLVNDFEQPFPAEVPIVEYMPPVQLSNEQVHSGKQAARINKDAKNGLLAGATWESLGRPHHLRVRLWVWLPNSRQNAAIVTALVQRPNDVKGNPGYHLGKQRMVMNEAIRHHRKWVHTTFFLSLPRGLMPTDEVAVCVWGQNLDDQDTIYFDDIVLENPD